MIVLLGPQRRSPTVRAAVADLAGGDDRPIALISAGWEEREQEQDEFCAHVGCPVRNLEVFGRVEAIYRQDPELHAATQRRHDVLEQLREIYRMRLRAASPISRELLGRPGDAELLDPEREAAIAAVRELDAHHLTRVRAIHDAFEAHWRPGERAIVAEQRAAVGALLAECGVVCIAGGHVGVLLNRLRLLGLDRALRGRAVVGWSAGAMVLTERIVLFHDRPPQGPSHAEVLDAGLDLAPALVALPDAGRRLQLDDPVRVAAFARRFQPALCTVLDRGARIDRADGRWRPAPGTRWLTAAGSTQGASAA